MNIDFLFINLQYTHKLLLSMRKIIPVFLFLILLLVSSFTTKTNTRHKIILLKEKKIIQQDPAFFYKKHCAFCHESESLIGPDMKIIKEIYLKKYPKKSEFTDRMLQFVKNPSKEKALYKKGIEEYTLMPKMPFKEEDLKAVIDYIYTKI